MKPTHILLLLTLSACSARPAPAARFNGPVPLRVTVRGALYVGTATVRGAGDALSGRFTVAGPVEVKGDLTGRIADNALVLDLADTIAANGCTGTMRLSGPLRGLAAEGALAAQDSCVGKMDGTFKLGNP